ncbi:MAG TPA: GDSL-type esterase/lipase family protein [Kofleriaceae bacterium]|nr:GDSL-type esterase/lipase family protein [Kofleriaceae bacterium]
MRRFLIVSIFVGLAARAEAKKHEERVADAVFVDPCLDGSEGACKRRALDGFYRSLAATDAGTGAHPTRISWFGDSLTADDQITDQVRHRLQPKFGDGGPGFVFAMPPHPFCEHREVKRAGGSGWTVYGVSTDVARDRLMGLGGAAESDGGWLRFAPANAAIKSADVFYLAEPHGGSIDVRANGTSVGSIATASSSKTASFQAFAVSGAVKKIELRASGHVRLFGVALEAASGVVVDNLGVVNATAKAFAKIKPDHWQAELAHRAPDLVVVMIGTNEAEWLPAKGAALDEHEQVVEGLLASVRAANPDASCLVISPLDQLDWRTEGTPARASVPAMVAAQEKAAIAKGCAFWDAYTWMGGKRASLDWFHRGLLTNDFQHPTTAGAHRIADAFAAGLLDGYVAYRARATS